jgi:hypothetical protein
MRLWLAICVFSGLLGSATDVKRGDAAETSERCGQVGGGTQRLLVQAEAGDDCQGATAKTPPASSATFPIGIRVDTPEVQKFWNEYALPGDLAWGGAAFMDLIAISRAGVKALVFGKMSVAEDWMGRAKARGFRYVMFNLEKIPITEGQTLIAQEKAACALAHSKGLKLVFAPTGGMLARYYKEIVPYADVVVYQTQSGQSFDPNYLATVRGLVQSIKEAKPGMPVWVQLSVTPPHRPDVPVAELVTTIRELKTFSDAILIFYYTVDNGPNSKGVARPAGISRLKQIIPEFRKPLAREARSPAASEP